MATTPELPATQASTAAFRAAQYVRMSTEHQQYSTHNQADKIQEYADRRGIEIVRTYADEGITLLQDKQFTPDVTRILRNMKAARQVEAVELMIASNTITVAHAEALLKATPLEQRTDVKPAEWEKKTAPIEQIEKLQKEMSQVQESYTQAEENYGSDLLNLVVAKGYLTKLLANGAVKSYIGRHEPEILTHLELVVNTVSMEEAVQQQQAETAEATQEEVATGL